MDNVFLTHGKVFHMDEVMAYAMLEDGRICMKYERITEEFSEDMVKAHHIVGDIGRVYDPERKRYDHHQAMIYRPNSEIPYATSGLIWKHYHRDILKIYFNLELPKEYDEEVNFVYEYVDKHLIQGIDANDTSSTYKVRASIQPDKNSEEISLHVLDFSRVISYFNRGFDNSDVEFDMAVKIASTIFRKTIDKAVDAYNFKSRFENWTEESEKLLGFEIVRLDGVYDWASHIRKNFPYVAYIICPSTHSNSKYALWAVQATPESRKLLLPIHRLGNFTDFIHLGKFIAGSDDIESLWTLARNNIRRTMNQVLNTTQVDKAFQYYYKHKHRIDYIFSVGGEGYPPTENYDKNEPSVWKPAYWLWFGKFFELYSYE